jgi:hypothetical protein
MVEIVAAATVRTHLHQEVIRRVQVHHPAVAAVQVHQEAAVAEVVAAEAEQLVRAEVAIKS